MDKLSFASVYRTAAILAAFSRADASSEEPCDEVSLVVAHPPAWVRWWTAAHRVRGGIANWAQPWRAEPPGAASQLSEAAADPTVRWMAHRPAAVLASAQAAPLVSHFAFCEDADLRHPETKL